MIYAFGSVLRHTARPKLIAWAMSELRPIVLSGPSGAGKSTLIKKLFQEYPDSFGFSVSHTTRKKRDGETEGKQYHFVSVEMMEKEIEDGKFIEYTNFSGNYYGTSIAAVKKVLDTNKICILDIDEQGVRNIKGSTLDAIYVFIKPPTMEELRRRLLSRGTETEESLERRMSTAASAITFSETPGVYDLIVENNDLETAYEGLRSFLRQTCPTVTNKSHRYDAAAELPLAANVSKLQQITKIEAGDSAQVIQNGFTDVKLESSVAEIPLSPSKTTTDHEAPAQINITETPLLVMTDIPENGMTSHDSSSVVELEGEADTISSDGVCGRQSWCTVS